MTSPPAINEPAILQYANAVLNANYTSLDGISDQELNRVWVIAQLDVLLQDYEVAAFMCKTPDEVLAEVENEDVCKRCGSAMKGAIECLKCGWLDLPF